MPMRPGFAKLPAGSPHWRSRDIKWWRWCLRRAIPPICSWASNVEKETVFVELRGDKSGAVLKDGTLNIYSEDNGVLTDITPKVVDNNPIHGDNLRHFANVLAHGVKPDFTPIQGVNMIKILEAMYKSAETGMEVRL